MSRAYVLPDGRMTSDAQTAYSLAIGFDLVPGSNACVPHALPSALLSNANELS